jgi:uncharacterized protein involved in exopolysaccharide biosynthesis
MNQQSANDDEISVKELLRIIWRGKFLVLSTTVAATLIVAFTALLSTKKYEATTIVSPVAEESNSSRLSSLISQVGGGLSSLADVAGLPSASNTQKSEIVAVLVSEGLTESYIRSNNLLPLLYHKQWDAVNQKWNVSDPKKVPTVWKANAYFKKNVRFVTTDNKTGLVRLVIAWEEPKLAAKWANDLVKMTNDYLRDKTIAEAERNIAYLTDQAAKTQEIGVKEAIYSILQNEIKKMMLARGSAEYALKIIDPAIAPEKAVSPQPVAWTIMGFFGGFVLSLLVIFVRYWWRTS